MDERLACAVGRRQQGIILSQTSLTSSRNEVLYSLLVFCKLLKSLGLSVALELRTFFSDKQCLSFLVKCHSVCVVVIAYFKQ